MNKGRRKKNVYNQHRKTLLKFSKTRFCPCCGVKMWSPEWDRRDTGKKKKRGNRDKNALATADHIIPRSRGGTDDLSNLRLICLDCNQRKGSELDGTAKPSLDRRAKPAESSQMAC